jgi:hypothetical protein
LQIYQSTWRNTLCGSENNSYILDEKSYIYSLGVLFWELTSCSSPFNFKATKDPNIMLRIINGKREDPVPNTNDKFVELYQRCWQHEPDGQPDIHQVILELKKLNNVDFEDNDVSTPVSITLIPKKME